MLKLSAPAHVENSNSFLSALVMIQPRTLAVDGEQLDCSVSCWYHGKHSGLCLQVELRDAYGHKDGEGLDEYQVHTVSGLVTIGGGPRSMRLSARRFVHWLRMNENEEAGSGRRSLAPLKDRNLTKPCLLVRFLYSRGSLFSAFADFAQFVILNQDARGLEVVELPLGVARYWLMMSRLSSPSIERIGWNSTLVSENK